MRFKNGQEKMVGAGCFEPLIEFNQRACLLKNLNQINLLAWTASAAFHSPVVVLEGLEVRYGNMWQRFLLIENTAGDWRRLVAVLQKQTSANAADQRQWFHCAETIRRFVMSGKRFRLRRC